ncbi:MAG: aldehyde ferredoxin oxidoreductase N-terminal domain-containing protein [Nanoarchaeota archaeon]
MHKRILQINAASCRHEVVEKDDPDVVGILDYAVREHLREKTYALSLFDEGNAFLLGIGPLVQAQDSSRSLVCMTRSPTAHALSCTALSEAGLLLHGAGFDAVKITGRAKVLSILLIRNFDQYLEARLIPLERQQLFEIYDSLPGGVESFDSYLARTYGSAFNHRTTAEFQLLCCGPAAFLTHMGSLHTATVSALSEGRIQFQNKSQTASGGFGSALVQGHNVCAVLFSGNVHERNIPRSARSAETAFTNGQRTVMRPVIERPIIDRTVGNFGLDSEDAEHIYSFVKDSLSHGLLNQKDIGMKIPELKNTAAGDSLKASLLRDITYGRTGFGRVFQHGLRQAVKELSAAHREQEKEKNMSFYDLAWYMPFGKSGYMLYSSKGSFSPLFPLLMNTGNSRIAHSQGMLHDPRKLGKRMAERYLTELFALNMGLLDQPSQEKVSQELSKSIDQDCAEYSVLTKKTAQLFHDYNAKAGALPIFWESANMPELVMQQLEEARFAGFPDPHLQRWLTAFRKNKIAAGHDYFYEMMSGAEKAIL